MLAQLDSYLPRQFNMCMKQERVLGIEGSQRTQWKQKQLWLRGEINEVKEHTSWQPSAKKSNFLSSNNVKRVMSED